MEVGCELLSQDDDFNPESAEMNGFGIIQPQGLDQGPRRIGQANYLAVFVNQDTAGQ